MGLAQQLINALSLGSIYALFAVGFGIVFATMKILNMAQGVYATYGAVAAYYVSSHSAVPMYLAVFMGVMVAALIAVIVDQLAFEPLRRRGAGLFGAIISSIGAWIALREIARGLTQSAPVGYPSGLFPTGAIRIAGDLLLLKTQLIAFGVSAAVITSTYLFVTRTRLGSAIRAVGFNRMSAQIVGVNPRFTIVTAALLSGGLTGLSGILLGVGQTFDFNMGDGLLLQGFAAVIIGGMSDIRGTALGGLLIGVVQTLSSVYLSNSYRDAITFGVILVLLLVRPEGLFVAKVKRSAA